MCRPQRRSGRQPAGRDAEHGTEKDEDKEASTNLHLRNDWCYRERARTARPARGGPRWLKRTALQEIPHEQEADRQTGSPSCNHHCDDKKPASRTSARHRIPPPDPACRQGTSVTGRSSEERARHTVERLTPERYSFSIRPETGDDRIGSGSVRRARPRRAPAITNLTTKTAAPGCRERSAIIDTNAKRSITGLQRRGRP